MLDVSGGYTAKTAQFRFLKSYQGLERIEKQGTAVAEDGGEAVTTPHDECYLVMPNHRAKKGERALRFGRVSA
jgi:hypothetical protein